MCSRLNAKGVLFGQLLTLRPVFWPTLGLFGENCLLKLLLVWANKNFEQIKTKLPYFPFNYIKPIKGQNLSVLVDDQPVPVQD